MKSVDKKNTKSPMSPNIDRTIELKNAIAKSENFKDLIKDSNNLNDSFKDKKNLNESFINETDNNNNENSSVDEHNSNSSLDSIKEFNEETDISFSGPSNEQIDLSSNEQYIGFFDNIFNRISDVFKKKELNDNKNDNIVNKVNDINNINNINDKDYINNINNIIIDNSIHLDHKNGKSSIKRESLKTEHNKNRVSKYLNFFSNDCNKQQCRINYIDDNGYLKTYKEYCSDYDLSNSTFSKSYKLSEAEYLDRIASEINYKNGKVCQTSYTRSSDVYNYLIILKKKDFEKSSFGFGYVFGCSRKDSIRHLENKMSGNLHIGLNTVDMCECHFKEYVVKNLIQTNQLYIQLPKEKSYVLANVWSLEYTKSQINEFIEILALLGAIHIKYKITNSEYAKVIRKGTLNTGLERFGLTTNASAASVNSDSIIFEGDIQFKDNKNKFANISQFNEYVRQNEGFSYLGKRADWRDIIKNRFTSNTIYYQFSFGNDHIEDNDFDVSLQFKKIGIAYDSEKMNHNNFTTLFNIDFESN